MEMFSDNDNMVQHSETVPLEQPKEAEIAKLNYLEGYGVIQ